MGVGEKKQKLLTYTHALMIFSYFIQFFNPNDFAHMSQRKTAPGQPHHKGRLQQQNDPFPDNVSK